MEKHISSLGEGSKEGGKFILFLQFFPNPSLSHDRFSASLSKSQEQVG